MDDESTTTIILQSNGIAPFKDLSDFMRSVCQAKALSLEVCARAKRWGR